ncbi:uncharacterized protein LOC144904724 [Branchiostoma floridae x Branchiostoma belcheri]
MEVRGLAKARTPKTKFSFIRARDDNQNIRSPSSQKRRRDNTGSGPTGKRQKLQFESESTTLSDPLATYKMNLRTEGEIFEVQDGAKAWVIRDWNGSRLQEGKYVVVEKMETVFTSDTSCSHSFWICSCREASNQRQRLVETSTTITEVFDEFVCREEALYCIHCRLVSSFDQDNVTELSEQNSGEDGVEDEDDPVYFLRAEPLLAMVFCDGSRALVGTTARQRYLHCLTCDYGTRNCSHVNAYREWLQEEGLDEPIDDGEKSTSLPCGKSWKSIPYPLPDDLRELQQAYDSGILALPENLVPGIPDSSCPNGFSWDVRDPVEEGWSYDDTVTVYTEQCSFRQTNADGELKDIKVYYRICTGDCGCTLPYDGQEDLLFNLNNKDVIAYSMLFRYLHLMLEARNPLAAFHRAYQRQVRSIGQGSVLPIHKLRLAWDSFAQLLSIDWQTSFKCTLCGTQPDVIICDGTSLGFRKDLIRHDTVQNTQLQQSTIQGSDHKERVFIPVPQTRVLLSQYAGVNPRQKKRGKALRPNALSPQQYRELVNSLSTVPHLSSLATLLQRLSCNGSNRMAPGPYKKFLSELAKNSPLCGMLQIAHSEAEGSTKAVVRSVVQNRVNLFDSGNAALFERLRGEAPILVDFLYSVYMAEGCKIPEDVAALVEDVLDRVSMPFVHGHDDSAYPPAEREDIFGGYSFFPNMPPVRGQATYAKDAVRRSRPKACRDPSRCNKMYGGHPTLSPGIFTTFCRHGVCYGFTVLKCHESPRHPFEILIGRFHRAPRVIIYDNACRLHQYCLNREPTFFRDTLFCVDRLHWVNHTGCSDGYCMDAYQHHGSIDVQKINSQINEQANAGLKRIKAQLAYMAPRKFLFSVALFLAFKNMDKQQQLE